MIPVVMAVLGAALLAAFLLLLRGKHPRAVWVFFGCSFVPFLNRLFF